MDFTSAMQGSAAASAAASAASSSQPKSADEARKADFKATFGDSHAKRRDELNTLRKGKRHARTMAKRRKVLAAADASAAASLVTGDQLKALVAACQSGSAASRIKALKQLRRALMVDNEPPIQAVIDLGAMPMLTTLLQSKSEELVLEAMWCLSNIATGTSEHAGLVLQVAPYLIPRLEPTSPILAEQAAHALGNVAGDCQEFRDTLAANGIIPKLVELLSSKDVELVATAAWAISNMLRGASKATPFMGHKLDEALFRVIKSFGGEPKVMREIAWVLCFIAAKPEPAVLDHLVTKGLLPVLANMFAMEHPDVVFPSCRALGNVCGANDAYCDKALQQATVLPVLAKLIMSDDDKAQAKEAMWVVSNIAGAQQRHRDALIAKGFGDAIVNRFLSGAFDMQIEAAVALANLMVCTSSETNLIAVMKHPDVLPHYMSLLSVGRVEHVNLRSVAVCLGVVELVLRRHPEGVKLVEDNNGIEVLEDLRERCPEPQVAGLAHKLVDEFYGEDYGLDDEAGDVAIAANGTFAFGLPAGVGTNAVAGAPAGGGRGGGRGRGMHMTLPAWAQAGASPAAAAQAAPAIGAQPPIPPATAQSYALVHASIAGSAASSVAGGGAGGGAGAADEDMGGDGGAAAAPTTAAPEPVFSPPQLAGVGSAAASGGAKTLLDFGFTPQSSKPS